MTRGKNISGDFIFKENANGTLEFVGDFEALYRHDPDPWGQLGGDERMGAYYAASRQNIARLLSAHLAGGTVLEVGCGFGQVCATLAAQLPQHIFVGADISDTAVQKAQHNFPALHFFQGDVTHKNFSGSQPHYDAVIINQVLWYVLEGFDGLLNNMVRMVKPQGVLMFCNAFMRTPQRYGKDKIDGFDGLVRALVNHACAQHFQLIDARLTHDETLLYDDGYVVMRRVERG